MTINDETRTVEPGDTIVIPPGARHRIVNVGTSAVAMIVACAPARGVEDNVFLE